MKREAITHSKMKRLCRRLDIPTWQAVGLLESIWQLTARETPRGDLGKLPDEDIALAIDYRGDASVMMLALVDTGWIDNHPQYRYVVHGWSEHCDDATNLKLARARQHFADGRAPKLTRLGGEERKTLEGYYAACAQIPPPCAQVDDPCARAEDLHAVRTPSAPPEPRPAITITPPEPLPAPPAAGAATRDGLSIVPHSGMSKGKPASFDRQEDDETPNLSPWEKICSRYRTAKGTGMDSNDARWLREQMELRNVTPETLLKLIDENPLTGFDTPIAGLKWLLKQAKAKTNAAAPVPAGAIEDVNRCPDCKCERGKGLTLLPDGKTWVRCHCALPEWIAHQRSRGVAIAEPAA